MNNKLPGLSQTSHSTYQRCFWRLALKFDARTLQFKLIASV